MYEVAQRYMQHFQKSTTMSMLGLICLRFPRDLNHCAPYVLLQKFLVDLTRFNKNDGTVIQCAIKHWWDS